MVFRASLWSGSGARIDLISTNLPGIEHSSKKLVSSLGPHACSCIVI